MATDPDAARHEQYVPSWSNPGCKILRNIETMQPTVRPNRRQPFRIKIENLRVPWDNILGGRGQASIWVSIGLPTDAYAWHNVAMAQALDWPAM